MDKVLKFEDLIAWQRAQDLSVEIYSVFKSCSDWDFRNQICRASVSISNNIAEGFNRKSKIEFIRFLYISLASASEVKSMLYLAYRLELTILNQRNDLLERVTKISKIITGLIKAVERKEKEK